MSEPPHTDPPHTDPTTPLQRPGTASEPATGDVVAGRYALLQVLGRGGMATVWRAHDPVLHRDVAVKIFQHAEALPDASARAAAEVRMLAGLKHPNLVSVYDAAGSTPDSFDVLVMELVEGRSLRDRLDEPGAAPLPPAQVAALGAELAAGLEHVHERGIVHRDLKPANILLERTSRGEHAKIADFGVARLLEGVQLTMVGTTVGTANYLSPEQATGSDVGPPSDIYSLALVLLECLTGVPSFPGHGVAAAAARLHRPPAMPVGASPAWVGLLQAMTEFDPSRRPDAAQVAAALGALAVGSEADAATAVFATASPATAVMRSVGGVATPAAAFAGAGTTVLPVEQERRRRKVGLPLAIGVIAAAIVALGLILGLGGTDDSGTAPGSGSTSTPARSTTTAPSRAATTSAPSTPRTSATSTPAAPAGPPADNPGKDKGPGGPGNGHGNGKDKNKP